MADNLKAYGAVEGSLGSAFPPHLKRVAVVNTTPERRPDLRGLDLTYYPSVDQIPSHLKALAAINFNEGDAIPDWLQQVLNASAYETIVKQIAGDSLIGYWPLDERSGSTAFDRSGNGRNGMHTGVTLLNPGVNALTNPGFESGDLTGWTAYNFAGTGFAAASTDQKHDGLFSGYVNGGSLGCFVHGVIYAFGTSATLITHIRRPDGSAVTNTHTQALANNSLANWDSIVPVGGGWYRCEITRAFDPSISFAQHWGVYAGAGQEIYVDDTNLFTAAPNGIRGATAPFYDGVNDFTNIYSAGLASAFSGAEGTLAIWARVSGAGVWTDSTRRKLAIVYVNAANQLFIEKLDTAPGNLLSFRYIAGTTSEQINSSAMSTTNWVHLVITWSKSGDAVSAYINGAQLGSTQTTLGTWAGVPIATGMVLGAANLIPDTPWSGLLNHAVLCNRALSAAEVARLYTAGLPLVA